MIIKDIVNRDTIIPNNCEHEPIHIPGSIQPHGFLLGIRESDRKIESGVGLALYRKIMQPHGRNIAAVGQPEKGVTITLYFPCDFNGQSIA